jgi:hypothetical protein
MNLSFQEKSLWLLFLSLCAAFGAYFASVLPGHGREVAPQQLVTFVAVVVLLVIAQIIGHILIAVFDRRATTDERDRLISLKGSRYGSWVLATGVFFSLVAGVHIPGNFAFTHLLLASWVVAQLVEIGSQLYLYRREA